MNSSTPGLLDRSTEDKLVLLLDDRSSLLLRLT
jgi:hypothetical protein